MDVDRQERQKSICAARDWLSGAADAIAGEDDLAGDLKVMLAHAELSPQRAENECAASCGGSFHPLRQRPYGRWCRGAEHRPQSGRRQYRPHPLLRRRSSALRHVHL